MNKCPENDWVHFFDVRLQSKEKWLIPKFYFNRR